MNQLIAHPFELQLNTWFENIADRITTSPVWGETLSLELESLRDKKRAFLALFREGTDEVSDSYEELVRQADELIQSVLVEEGPTEYTWLNVPLRSIEAYLSGKSLDSRLAEYLGKAFEMARSLNDSALVAAVRELLLWSEGHKALTGLELKALFEQTVSAAQGTDFVVEETIESLLNLLEQSSLEEQDEILDRLSEKLSQWEADFLSLETHVEQHIPEELDSMDALALLFEEFALGLEDENAGYGELSKLLKSLQQAWSDFASRLTTLLSLRSSAVEEVRFSNLESLQQVASDFQIGRQTVESLQTEVDGHSQRWSSVQNKLPLEWSQQPANKNRFETINLCLSTLKTVVSPGDARLAPIAELYSQTVKALLKAA